MFRSILLGVFLPLVSCLSASFWGPLMPIGSEGGEIGKSHFSKSQSGQYALLMWEDTTNQLLQVSIFNSTSSSPNSPWSIGEPFFSLQGKVQMLKGAIADSGSVALAWIDSSNLHHAIFDGIDWHTYSFPMEGVTSIGLGVAGTGPNTTAVLLSSLEASALLGIDYRMGQWNLAELSTNSVGGASVFLGPIGDGFVTWIEQDSFASSNKFVFSPFSAVSGFGVPLTTVTKQATLTSHFTETELAVVGPNQVVPVVQMDFLLGGLLPLNPFYKYEQVDFGVLTSEMREVCSTYKPSHFDLSGNGLGVALAISSQSGIFLHQFAGGSWNKNPIVLSSFLFDVSPKIHLSSTGKALALWMRGNQLISRWFNDQSWEEIEFLGEGISPEGVVILPSGNAFSDSFDLRAKVSKVLGIWQKDCYSFVYSIGSSPSLVPPPNEFRGEQIVNKFLTQKGVVNLLDWSLALDPQIVSYKIFRDGIFLRAFKGTENHFEDLVSEGERHTYALTALDRHGNESTPTQITI